MDSKHNEGWGPVKQNNGVGITHQASHLATSPHSPHHSQHWLYPREHLAEDPDEANKINDAFSLSTVPKDRDQNWEMPGVLKPNRCED